MKFSVKIKWKNGINVSKGLEFCQNLMPHSYPELARGYSELEPKVITKYRNLIGTVFPSTGIANLLPGTTLWSANQRAGILAGNSLNSCRMSKKIDFSIHVKFSATYSMDSNQQGFLNEI